MATMAIPASFSYPRARGRATTGHGRGGGQATIRRQPTMRQGIALESLGHAVEYLVDSRMYQVDEAANPGDDQAVRILMRLSREVFGGCAERVPLRRRALGWLREVARRLAPGHRNGGPGRTLGVR